MNVVWLFLVLAQSATATPSVKLGTTLETYWRDVARTSVWRSPTTVERETLRDALHLALDGSRSCEASALAAVRERLAPIYFEVLVTRDGADSPVWIIRERATRRRGGGLYALRCGKAEPVVLQAPHAFHDVGTGEIVRRLFVEGKARAAFWNTVHRYKATTGERPEDTVHPADVAHEPGNLFHAATVGAAVDSELRFVQFHGFAGSEATPFDAVLSSGTPALRAEALGKRLMPLGKIALFGADTTSLGATTNAQARALNRSAEGRFLHVELGVAVRKRLRESATLRGTLLASLGGRWW